MVLVAHNELGHDAVEAEAATGAKSETCPLYPGMTCREHCDAAVDIDNARDDALIRVPFIELCPNSWLVPPHGEPERIAEADQFLPKKVQAQAEKMQKRLGATLSRDAHRQVLNALQQAETGADEEQWNKALQALAGLAALVRKPPASLRRVVDERLEGIEEGVRFAFEDAYEVGRRDDTPMSARIDAVRALVKTADVAVYGKKLPVVAEMRAWLAKHAETTPRK